MPARRWARIAVVVTLGAVVIVIVATVCLFIYKPLPAEGFDFSSAGEIMHLSDGRALAYLEAGDPDGQPVFYFHGGPGSRLEANLFDGPSRQLEIRLIATDRPGYGLSDVCEDCTYLDWPKDVTELADHLGIGRFAVLGWSSGGPHAAAVAHGVPERVTVAVIVSGEAPYASDDLPRAILSGKTFSGSWVNKLFIWSARNGQWLMSVFLRLMRIMVFRNPIDLIENSGDSTMSAKDIEFFRRSEYAAAQVEAFRQGVDGAVRDFTIERLDWPFKLENIRTPVLVFHGAEDGGVDPRVAEYVCMRIPSCDSATIYSGEGHSAIHHRYKEIIRAMLDAWE